MQGRIGLIVSLAEANPEHLEAFARDNEDIFLNPARVGDTTQPLPTLLANYLHRADLDGEMLNEIESAMRTGDFQCRGDADDDLEYHLDEHWRDDPFDAWAIGLTSSTVGTSGGCILTPDGRCVGPLPVAHWLSKHVPSTVAMLKRGCGAAPDARDEYMLGPHVVISAAQQLACRVANRIEEQLLLLRPSVQVVRDLLARLLLILHCVGEQPDAWFRMVAERRESALQTAYTACRFLVEYCNDSTTQSQLRDQQLGTTDVVRADVCCVAFIASQLLEQDLQATQDEALHNKHLIAETLAWRGDDEGTGTMSLALLDLSLTIV